jgi:hypothetical protein
MGKYYTERPCGPELSGSVPLDLVRPKGVCASIRNQSSATLGERVGTSEIEATVLLRAAHKSGKAIEC